MTPFQTTLIQKKNTKVYLILIKRFFNNKNIQLIPPFFHENEYVINFKKKAKLFNSFFAIKCSLIGNSSELPLNFHYTTKKHLNTLNLSNADIEKVSIRMIKIYSKSISKPLQLIFSQCISTGSFPLEQKKAKVVPVDKKGDK